MSSFLCFICHSTINAETSEEIREKYREIVGMNLCPDSQLCHICCHVLNKLSLFRSICLKRSLEYPVLFSEKGTINLQKSNTELLEIPCSDNPCNLYQSSSKAFQFTYDLRDCYSPNNIYNAESQYVALEDDNQFKACFTPVTSDYQIKAEGEDIEGNDLNHDHDFVKNNDNLWCKADLQESNDEIHANNKEPYEKSEDHYETEKDQNCEDIHENDDIYDSEIINDQIEVMNESTMDTNELKKKKKRKKRVSKELMLTVEEQKSVLEARRKDKKYLNAEFKCYSCALPFLFKDTYQTHMMRHEESNGEYLCPICTLRFASPSGLRSHALIHARRVIPAPRPSQRATCHLCGRLLKDANGLQQHLRRVHMSKGNRLHSCNVCGESFPSQPKLRTHMIKHIRRKFTCTECSATYSSPYTLAQHRKKHYSPPEHHRCGACGKQYSSWKGLLAHRRNAAAHQQSAVECPMCSKICPNQRSLTLHVQAIHSNAKDHACPHCPARYSTRRSLLRHVASHTQQVQPAVATCHMCGNCFKGKSKLNRHLKNVCEKEKLQEQLTLYE